MRWAPPSAACHRTGAPLAHQIRAWRLPALRPGQVVPGRAAAALGAVHLLAARRPAVWHRPELFADEREPGRLHQRGCPPLHPRAGRASWGWAPAHQPRATRTSSTTSGASASCRSTWTPSIPSSTTRWSAPGCAGSSGSNSTRWWATCCPCRPRMRDRHWAGHGLVDRPLVLPRRPHVPAARRFAHGLPAAAGFAALGPQGKRLPLPDRAGPVCPARCRCRSLRAQSRAPPSLRTPITLGGGFAEGGTVAVASRRACGLASGRPRRWPSSAQFEAPRPASDLGRTRPPTQRFESAHWITRTALCVEVRDPHARQRPEAPRRSRRQSPACSTSSCRR
jgi:hypothetical protein